jgi:putative restriction endonuclease
LITIAEDMTVCVSRKYGSDADPFYEAVLRNYVGQLIEIPEKFIPIAEFLAYHSGSVFERS